LKALVRRVRAGLRLKQGDFARTLDVSEASVQNWENGRNRPSPNLLRKMAQMVPALAVEIQREIEGYEWHPKRLPARSTGKQDLGQVDPQQWEEVLLLCEAKKEGAPEELVERLINLGLRALDPRGALRAAARRERQRARKRA